MPDGPRVGSVFRGVLAPAPDAPGRGPPAGSHGGGRERFGKGERAVAIKGLEETEGSPQREFQRTIVRRMARRHRTRTPRMTHGRHRTRSARQSSSPTGDCGLARGPLLESDREAVETACAPLCVLVFPTSNIGRSSEASRAEACVTETGTWVDSGLLPSKTTWS